jgi:cytochrome c-type biogenesis protein CcmE
MKNRVTLTIVLVAITVIALLARQAMVGGTSAVLKPSELHALGASGSRERIRVAGRVIAEGMSYQVEPNLELKFSITDPIAKPAADATSTPSPITPASIPVIYHGIKPDMFSEGRDVIIDGDFKNGQLEAVKLLTQCPSKYEPPKPNASPAVSPSPATTK